MSKLEDLYPIEDIETVISGKTFTEMDPAGYSTKIFLNSFTIFLLSFSFVFLTSLYSDSLHV